MNLIIALWPNFPCLIFGFRSSYFYCLWIKQIRFSFMHPEKLTQLTEPLNAMTEGSLLQGFIKTGASASGTTILASLHPCHPGCSGLQGCYLPHDFQVPGSVICNASFPCTEWCFREFFFEEWWLLEYWFPWCWQFFAWVFILSRNASRSS